MGFLSGTSSRRGASRSALQSGTSHSEPGRVRSPTSTRSPSPGRGQTLIPEAQAPTAPHPKPELERSSPRSTPGLRPHFRLWASLGLLHAPTSAHPARVPSSPGRLSCSCHLLSRPTSSPRSLPVRPPRGRPFGLTARGQRSGALKGPREVPGGGGRCC